MTIETRLSPQPFQPDRELAEFLAGLAGEGAAVSFVGVARAKTRDGAGVERMFLDHHPTMTERSLEEIAADAARRFAVGHVRIIHRCGAVAPGEPIVFAAAAAAHRRSAFEAADFLMDRLKTDAVFWKREDGADGSTWIEPTEGDRADRARWS